MSSDATAILDGPEAPGGSIAAGLAALVGLSLLALGLQAAIEPARPRAPRPATVAPSAFDPSKYLLNALLVPALDPDMLPLQWVDPRPAMGCGPGTVVRVDNRPIRAGTPVPDRPFVLDWRADGCRPFGPGTARFDGRVLLTVYREDWGFSATVEPADLRIEIAPGQAIYVERGSATTPREGRL